jgi:hypothetical protein
MLPNGTKLYPGQSIPSGFNTNITLEPVWAPWNNSLFSLVGREIVFNRVAYEALPEEEKCTISIPMLGEGILSVDMFGSGLNGDMLYEGLTKIRYIVMPEEIMQIGNRAFKDMEGLRVVNIPQKVGGIDDTQIRPSVFRGTQLAYIWVGQGSSAYVVDNGVLFNTTRTTLVKMIVQRQSYRVPAGVRTIAPYAFENDRKLVTINFNDDLEQISDFAFIGCEGLRSIVLPSGLKNIQQSSFQDCINLTGVTFNVGLEFIGIRAFAGCTSLLRIDLPNTLVKIGNRAFENCTGIIVSEVVIPESVSDIESEAFWGSAVLSVRLLNRAFSTVTPPPFESGWRDLDADRRVTVHFTV